MPSNDSRTGLAVTNDAVRFCLEVAVLLLVGYWGYRTGETRLVRIGAGVGLPLLVATIWGLFASPKAPYRLADFRRAVLETVVFGVAALALVSLGQPVLAGAFATLAAGSIVLTHRFENVERPWDGNDWAE